MTVEERIILSREESQEQIRRLLPATKEDVTRLERKLDRLLEMMEKQPRFSITAQPGTEVAEINATWIERPDAHSDSS